MPFGRHIWATDADLLPDADDGSRGRRDLRLARPRTRPHLQGDRGDQLRAGRDGDVHDVHRVRADEPRHDIRVVGVLRHAGIGVRRGRGDPADADPSARARERLDGRDGDDRAARDPERPRRVDLVAAAAVLPEPVPDHLLGDRRRAHLEAGHGHVRRRHGVRRRALGVLPLHQARPGDARGRAQPGGGASHGRAHLVAARARLGLRGGARRGQRDDGRADRLPDAEHDAGRAHLRLRGGGARRAREPGRRGRGRARARRAPEHARAVRAPGDDGAAAAGRARDPARRAARASRRAVRARGGAARMRRWPLIGFAVLVVVVVMTPFVTSNYRTYQFGFVGLYLVALLGLDLLTGFTGQISLGHGAFMGIGAYTTTILVVDHGWRDLVTLPVAGLVAGLIGIAFGIPATRFSGPYLALATFAIPLSFIGLLKRFPHLTGGNVGKNLPQLHSELGWHTNPSIWFYVVCWATALVMFPLAFFVVRGRFGRALRAV